MSYRKRLTFLVLLDTLTVATAIFVASWIVYPTYENILTSHAIIISAIALVIFHHLFAAVFKLYKKVWAYASVGELLAIVKSVTLSVACAGVVQFLMNDFTILRRALVVTWLLHIILIGSSRFVWRLYRDNFINKDKQQRKRTLVVGAGSAGAMIVRQLQNEHNSELDLVAFVDDDPAKQHMELYNLPVVGKVADIPMVVEKHNIEHIVIAIPSLKTGELKEIVEACTETPAQVQMIPKIEDLMTGKVTVSSLKNIEVEDLLGREPVKLDIDAISEYLTDNIVMVTGAGGSIGSEICRQLMQFSPRKLLLVGHGEYSIYSIDMELRKNFADTNTEIVPIIGDIKDRKRMFDIVGEYLPAVIYHAAAHKHVPLMEYNPHEAVKNNIIGTKNVAEAADHFGVGTFVLVSTDKAVNPTNVMGASKRIAEMVIQNMAKQSNTKFVAVRFGNVLGSRGSVIPLFREQIKNGGPITVTHPDITRYFMTIPEASRLVIQAGTLAKGGEIFVLDMGEPVKIVDLARNLIRLSGYTEDEIKIEFTGLRPGEKMFEELLGKDEILPGEVYEKIYIGRAVSVHSELIDELIGKFKELDNKELKEELMKIVYLEREQLAVQA